MNIVKEVYGWSNTWNKWMYAGQFDTLKEAEAHTEHMHKFGYETTIDWRDIDTSPAPRYLTTEDNNILCT